MSDYDEKDLLEEFEKMVNSSYGSADDLELDFDDEDFGYFNIDDIEVDTKQLPPPIPKEEKKNDLYCRCLTPELVDSSADGKSFKYCRKCKKENE